MKPHRQAVLRQNGFTLIELLVGMLLAMLTTIIIAQVMKAAEGHRRAATSGSDAQVNGALALYTLQREIQGAGYGVGVNPPSLGCPVNYNLAGTAGSFTLAPVVITSGGGGAASDTIRILSGANNGVTVPALLTASTLPTPNYFTVKSSFGIKAGDMVAVVPGVYSAGMPCTLFQVAADAGNVLNNTLVPHVVSTNPASLWNGIAGTAAYPTGGYSAGSTLVNLGTMVNRSYTVSANNNLQYTDLAVAGTANTLFSQIVKLRALYGKSSAGNGTVDTYTDATPTTNAEWKKVLAVRIAVVARNANYEKDAVTTAPIVWNLGADAVAATVAGAATCAGSTCITMVDTSTDSTAQHYRYRVFDTIIPLRNVLWNS